MKNIVLLLLVHFFNNSDQQYYIPVKNACNVYEELLQIIDLQQQYINAISQSFAYIQNRQNTLATYAQNENEASFRGGFNQPNNIGDQNMYWNYETNSYYTPYTYSGDQYPYGNAYTPGTYEDSLYPIDYNQGSENTVEPIPIIEEEPPIIEVQGIGDGDIENFIEEQPFSIEDTDINNHPNWRYFDHDDCGETSSDRIIGGEKAHLGQYPWLALIGYQNEETIKKGPLFSCGGALINSCWVLTAAHCIGNLPGTYYVHTIRIGEHNLDTDIDCDPIQCADPPQDFSPEKIIIHESFNNPKQKNDIGLIKLDKPAIYSPWVTPICLPRLNLISENFIGKIGEVAGWGIYDIKTQNSSKELLTVKLKGTTIDQCQKYFRKTVIEQDSQICVGGVIGKDSCNGDSGGPLMKVDAIEGESPKYFMFGLVSFGSKQCGKKPIPAIYTRIGYFLPWILNHIHQC